MRNPEWSGSTEAFQERTRRKNILREIDKINPANDGSERVTARHAAYLFEIGTKPTTEDYDIIIGEHSTPKRQQEAETTFKMLTQELGEVRQNVYSPGLFALDFLHGLAQGENLLKKIFS